MTSPALRLCFHRAARAGQGFSPACPGASVGQGFSPASRGASTPEGLPHTGKRCETRRHKPGVPAPAAAMLLVMVTAAAQAPATPPAEPPPQVEKAFAAGGSVYLDLSAGGYVIEGTADPRIRIRYKTREPTDAGSVRATADVTGQQARIMIAGPKNGFSVRIELPVRSDVTVSLSAGDLTLGALEGNKDISAWAGKIQVAVPKPDDYYSVQASVTAGQVRAESFHIEKGGLFRSFSWEGKGRHSLRVRLTAGDVIINGADKK